MEVAVVGGVAAGVAADAINKLIVAPLIDAIKDLINLSENNRRLQDKLKNLKYRLESISKTFQDQQRAPADTIRDCLKRTEDAIEEAKSFIHGSYRCLNCHVARQMRQWNLKVDQLLSDLRNEILEFVTIKQMVKLSPQEAETMLQPEPVTGYVGSRITDAKARLETWINAGTPQVVVIGVYGMAGVGKTTLLSSVHNSYKISKVFNVVIWVKVSPHYEISDVQGQIAEAIDLDLSSSFSTATRMVKLSISLKKMKFLLILDDIWSALDLQELGVVFDTDKGSKVVFSTRDQALMAVQNSITLEPLSTDDGWELFQKVAFEAGDVLEDLKQCGRNFAAHCEGLPLAITVVAAAIKSSLKTKTVGEWNTSLSLMEQADPSFPLIHPNVHKKLYEILKYSYDHLPHLPRSNIQNCFLYCGMYPKNKKIDVDILVRMWIAEEFFQSKEASYSRDMEIGHGYVKLLIDRCLFQNDNVEKLGNVKKPENVWKPKYITVHDSVREMSIYIAEGGRKWSSRAGQQIKSFPQCQTSECERLSLSRNQIKYLPEDLKCPKLVSLFLSENPIISNDHLETLLTNLTCLRVLDLSHTSLESVPTSLGQLTLLKFLTLKKTLIRNLPESICNLSNLQVLDLSSCEKLRSLPCTMEKLTQLQYLNLSGMSWDLITPLEISQLTSLKRLELYTQNPKALQGLTNLIELNVTISSKTGADEIASIGTWLAMRHLSLRYVTVKDPPPQMQRMESLKTMDLVANWDLPQEMESIVTLVLNNLRLKILPHFICKFRELERLEFIDCCQLTQLCPLEKLPKLKFLKFKKCTEIKDLEIGNSGELNGFPMLQRLDLIRMPKLQSLVTPTSQGGPVLLQGTLSNLIDLKIIGCPKLNRLPSGMERLSGLKTIVGEDYWWKDIFWPNTNMEGRLQKLFKVYKVI